MMKYDNGNVYYEGEWKDGKANGSGVCLWIVSRCILALYSSYWLLVMRVFIGSMTKNRW